METKANTSVVLYAPNDIRIEHKAIDAIDEDEVLIEMQSVGICGSDVHYWKNGRIGDFILKAPMVLGHESSGRVVSVGSKVKNLKEGDRVAIEPGVPCRFCDFCKSGRYNLCKDIVFCATPPFDGSLRKYYKHPHDFCFKLPDNVSYEEGALLEPLSVAVHACRRASVSGGDYVLVLGAGPIGLLNLMTAKSMGAVKVCITDISNSRLELAKTLGADHVINVSSGDIASISAEIEKALRGMPHKTIECSGADSSINLGIEATKNGGKMVLVGLGKPMITLPLIKAACKEIDLIGVFRYANCYQIALDLIANGVINVKPLITHSFKLSESVKAFETAHSGQGVKVIIECQE